MAVITTPVTAITKMVRGRMEYVPPDAMFVQTTLHSVRHIIEQLTTFASHFVTTKWGGNHGFLLLVLRKAKAIPASDNSNLEYERLKKPELLNPRIGDSTQNQYLLQFQVDQKVGWQEYTFQ